MRRPNLDGSFSPSLLVTVAPCGCGGVSVLAAHAQARIPDRPHSTINKRYVPIAGRRNPHAPLITLSVIPCHGLVMSTLPARRRVAAQWRFNQHRWLARAAGRRLAQGGTTSNPAATQPATPATRGITSNPAGNTGNPGGITSNPPAIPATPAATLATQPAPGGTTSNQPATPATLAATPAPRRNPQPGG